MEEPDAEKERLIAVLKRRGEKLRWEAELREKDRLDVELRKELRFAAQQRENNLIKAERGEKERLDSERQEKEGLLAELRGRLELTGADLVKALKKALKSPFFLPNIWIMLAFTFQLISAVLATLLLRGNRNGAG